jgi:integrase
VWRGKFGEPKTANAVRAFAISAPLAARLGELGSGLLFHTRNGTPWDANLLVKRKLYPLLDSLGIARGGLHAFRHANASMMDALAVPMKVRQQRLGHSDITLTMNVYTHIASEDDTQAAEQIAGVLWPNVAKSKKEGLPENQEALVIQ